MKKILCCLLLLLVCACALAAPVRVTDDAHLLTEGELSALLSRADALSEKHNLDIIIATTNNSYNMELGYYAANLVDYNGFKDDNIILAVAMDQRKYVCVTTGYGIDAFTDYTLETIYDAMEESMIAGEYAKAFDTYLMLCDRVLKQAETGTVYDYNFTMDVRPLSEQLLTRLGISAVVGIIIGWLIAYSRKKRMNTAIPQRSAENYMTHMHLSRERDIYLYTTTTRRKVQSESSSGGSSTFSGSSGNSHGGGGSGRSF